MVMISGENGLIVQDPEEFPHDIFTGGSGPWDCKNMKDGGTGSGSGCSGRCMIQPDTFWPTAAATVCTIRET